MRNVIKFYSNKGKYGCFSNFSNHPVSVFGMRWKTSEHAFQAQKFKGAPAHHFKAVHVARTPMEAKRIGNSRKRPLRKDWESVKDDVMYQVVKAKFMQHDECRELLLSTGDAKIVENAPYDSYWGCGKTGKGKNKLGKILMRVREDFRVLFDA